MGVVVGAEPQLMSSPKKIEGSSNDTTSLQWEELQRARNRLNSKRTRERERTQIDHLESEKARLWVSNDAIKFQNAQYREAIARIREVKSSKLTKSDGTSAKRPGTRQDVQSVARSILSSASPINAPHQGLESVPRAPPMGAGGSIHSLLPGGVAGCMPGHQSLTSLMLAGGNHPSDPSSLSTLQQLRYQSALSSAHLGGFLPPQARDIDRHLLQRSAAAGNLLPSELELRLLRSRGGLYQPEELLVHRADAGLGGFLPDGPPGGALSLMNQMGGRASGLAEHEQQFGEGMGGGRQKRQRKK